MATHHYTEKTYYYYDATLTQDLLTKYINTLSSSSATKTDTTYLPWGAIGNMSRFTGSRHEPNPEVTSGESEEPHPSTVEHDYVNFINATGVNFDQARSAAVAAGVDPRSVGNGISLNDVGLQATNITFADGGAAGAYASNTTLSNLTFLGKGGIVEIGGGFVDDANGNPIFVGGQSLNGLKAEEDLDTIVLYPPSRQAATSAVSATNITVSRNLNDLAVAAVTRYGYYGAEATSNRPGTGVEASKITVHGALRYVNIGSGARVDSLTVGDWKQWGDGEASAFLGEDVWGSTSHMSATIMNVYSGGTATNIYLGFGGEVHVSGPGMIYSSQLVSSSGQSWYQYTSSEGTGAGGVLTDLKMATSGGIQFTGNSASELNQKLWKEPTVGYGNRPYMNGYLATAPQSSYVSFGKFTSGRNIEIGNGGSLYIDKGARVSAISMGGLTTSTFFKNSSGTTDTWIGDRGASLQIRGGYVSGVVMDPVLQTFDYYSAAHDYFWLYSSSVSSSMQAAYSSAHGEYASGSAWESAVYASASAGYRQYMSAMYTSGAVYTNLGDDTAYNRRYVGGDIGVAGGWIMNVSGFSYLGVAADVDVTVSNNVSTWKTYQYTDGNVSKAIGAVSATLDVTGGAHVYNVKIEGGRVIMTGGGEVNARWHSRENKQSNYNLVEDLDLRIGDVLGLGSAYPAVIVFNGGGSGGYSQAIHDSKGGVTGYVDYFWDAIDPGEIHSATASKGLVVSANWNKQDFTYIGSGAVTFNGLGTVVLKDNHSRYTSDSYYGKGPYLGSAFDTYYFGVVKGVYNEEDGTLENYTVLDGTDGGFDWTGFLMVGSGGIVQNIGSAAPLKTGNDIVNSDTWTPSYTRDECKVLTVVAGGLADNVTVKGAVSIFEHYESQYTESRAGLLVSSGGTATNVTVLEGGIAMAKGGTIDKVFVAGGGTLYLSGWAGAHQVAVDSYGSQLAGPQYMDTTVLNGVRLDSGGQLTNTLDWGFRKGNAPSVIANKGGGIMNGVTANGVAYVSGLDYAGNLTLTKDQQALDVTVRGFLTITSRDAEGNPMAYTTTIASLNVSSGGIVKNATVGEEGAIYVSEGANVSGLTASGGRLIFENEDPNDYWTYLPGSAAVAGITVIDGGSLQVNSKFALKATDMQIKESAGLEVNIVKDADEDHAVTELNGTWTAAWGGGTFSTTDGVLSGFGGQFGYEYRDLFYSSAYTSARLSMTFLNGATLLDGDMRGYGYFSVRDGAKVLNTKLKGLTANIGGGGYASGLFAMTDPTNSAYQTNIYVYGNSQKGTSGFAEQTVMSGGYMMVEDGGFANGVTMLAPEGYEGPAGDSKKVGPVELEIVAGGTVSNVVASAGVVTIAEGSKAPGTGPSTLSNAEIHSSAMLLVNADGVVLGGALKLGGTVVTTAERYKYVEVQVTDPDTGDTYTDWQRETLNNAVADASTLTVTFDLTERDGGEETAMIDNLANLDGVKLAGITVSADQMGGNYVLAGGAADFNGTLTVTSDGKEICTLGVGDTYQVSADVVYSLTNSDETGLVFSAQTVDAAVTNIVATSDGKELLKGKWSKYAINIKTEVNDYAKSIWYRIKKAVLTRGPVGENEWLEFDNEQGLTISEYCTVEFKAKDANGKDSRIVSYTVNYDVSAPELSDLRVESGAPVPEVGAESVLSVLVSDDHDPAPKVELNLGNDEWTVVEVEDDSRAYFKVTGGFDCITLRTTDHADNVTTLVVSAPAAPVVSADILTVTNQDVTLTAEFSADAMVKQYTVDGGETWMEYDGSVVLEDNATVSFRAGNPAGYSASASITVDYIDKTPPEAPTVAADITTPTKESVTLTATFSEDSVKKLYSLDGGENWEDYNEGGVIIIINGTVGFCGVDEAGNASETTYVKVENIDREPPVISLFGDNETPLQGSTLTVRTNEAAEVLYSTDNENWTKYEGEISVTANGTYYVKATDTVGNVGTAEYVFENIDTAAPVITLTGDNQTALQQVTLMAESDDGSAVFYRIGDTGEWTEYTGALTVSANGTYFFQATDVAGNVGTASIAFANIDTTGPSIVLRGNNTTPLRSSVLAASAEEGVELSYSTDNETWTKYEGEIAVTANGTYYFKATDAVGNTGMTSITFANIDNEPPVITLTGDNETILKSSTLTATVDDGSEIFYSTDNETWTKYEGEIAVTANGMYYFKATDAVGNTGTAEIKFDNIDVVAPVITLRGDNETPLQRTTLFAAVDDGSEIFYSTDQETWTKYEGEIAVDKNGSFFFKATDAAGNEGTAEITFANIDNEPPEAPEAQADITTLTNKDVTVTATFSEDSVKKEYTLDDGKTWQDYTVDGVIIIINGTVGFRGTDAAGNSSEVFSVLVDNIDKTLPVITLAGDTVTALRASTLTASTEEGLDIFYSLEKESETWTKYEGEIAVTANGTYYFRTTDAAGNVGTAEITFGNIDNIPPEKPVATADIVEITDRNVTVTATFSEDSVLREYSRNETDWFVYTDPITFEKNGTVLFRAADALGNMSDVVAFTVDNIVINGPDKHENDSPLNGNGGLNEDLTDSKGIPLEEEPGPILLDNTVDYIGQNGKVYKNYVSAEDTADFAKITLDHAARLSFTVTATDKVKLTLYKLVWNEKKQTWNMKALKSVSITKAGDTKETASVLLNADTYYLGVENKNSKTKDGAYYNVSITTEGKNTSEFFSDGDGGANNGTPLVTENKKKVPSKNIANFLDAPITDTDKQSKNVQFDTNEIIAEGAPAVDGGWKNFVGFGDDSDTVKLSMTQPVELSFTINATGNVKLVVYSLSLNAKGQWVQKALQTVALSLKKTQVTGEASSKKTLLLDRLVDTTDKDVDGVTGYYVSVQSTNAAKGGSAYYNVTAKASVYSDADESIVNETGNGWLYEKKTGKVNTEANLNLAANKEIANGDAIKVDKGDVNFVGFGDEYDYAAFTVDVSGKYSFTLETTGAAKFTVYSLTDAKGGKKTQKSLLTQAVKMATTGTGVTTAKTAQLEAGVTYYVSMQSTNAKKGDEVYYNITANLSGAAPKAALDMPDDLFAAQPTDALAGVAAYDVDSQLTDDRQSLQSIATLA